jgi:hypothetical protein
LSIIWIQNINVRNLNLIDGEMDCVLASSVVDPGFESRSGQSKDYKISRSFFSAHHLKKEQSMISSE